MRACRFSLLIALPYLRPQFGKKLDVAYHTERMARTEGQNSGMVEMAVQRAENVRLPGECRGKNGIVLRVRGNGHGKRVFARHYHESQSLKLHHIPGNPFIVQTVHPSQPFVAENACQFREQKRRNDQ